jgi:hypothetical protein
MYRNYLEEEYVPLQYPMMCPMMMYRMEDINEDRLDKTMQQPQMYQAPQVMPQATQKLNIQPNIEPTTMQLNIQPTVQPQNMGLNIQPTMQPQNMGLNIQPTMQPQNMELNIQPTMEPQNMELYLQPKMQPNNMELNIEPKMGSVIIAPIKLELKIVPVMEPTKMQLNIQPVMQHAQWPVMQQQMMPYPMPKPPCSKCHKKVKPNANCNAKMKPMAYPIANLMSNQHYPMMMNPMEMEQRMIPFEDIFYDDFDDEYYGEF